MARKVILIVAVAFVVLCGGGGFAVYKVVSSVSAPIRSAANGFVDDLGAGRLDSAYGRLCADTQRRFSPSSFAGYVHSQPRFTKHTTRGFSANDDNGRHTATVSMDLIGPDGGKQQHLFTLVKEGRDYKVCGNPY